jgi:hypothetical protein
MTNPLSPAAQAVLDAYMANCGWLDGPLQKDYQCAAAVLRTVVQELKYFGVTEKNILEIAAELETINEEDDFNIVVELEESND